MSGSLRELAGRSEKRGWYDGADACADCARLGLDAGRQFP